LNPNARTLLKGVIKPDVLDEVITVSIDNEFLADALGTFHALSLLILHLQSFGLVPRLLV
jgi:hypothetical protein